MRDDLCLWYGSPYQPEDPPEPEKKKDPEEPPKKVRAAHALVLGRFDPPHAGHQLVVDVARSLAATTTVLVRVEPGVIDSALRLAWARELFGARIGVLDGPRPASTPDRVAFWTAWADRVAAALARLPTAPRVDALVSSDREAWRLAELLGARDVLVDPDRVAVPISATAIRRDPFAAWDYLPPPVRAHYAQRAVVIGPESSGKSTFAAELARQLRTVHVAEQARMFAERRGGELRETDLAAIAELQIATEDAAARRANRTLVADTDVLSLALWAERLFGRAPALATRVPDVYFVTGAELPFVGRADRDDPAARRAFAARCLAAARASGARVVELPADRGERLAVAQRALTTTRS